MQFSSSLKFNHIFRRLYRKGQSAANGYLVLYCRKNGSQALAFLRWTCDEGISNYFTIMGGQTAISNTYTNDEMVKLYPWLPLYFKTYPNTQPQYQLSFPDGRPIPSKQIDDVLCKWAYKCLIYNMDISAAIAATNQELTELLSQ